MFYRSGENVGRVRFEDVRTQYQWGMKEIYISGLPELVEPEKVLNAFYPESMWRKQEGSEEL